MTRARMPFAGALHDISECSSTDEILKTAGLDWEMVKRPLITETADGVFHTLKDKAAVVTKAHNGHEAALGPVVGKNYEFIQWDQFVNLAADFLPFGAKLEYAGSLHHGTRGLIQLDMPEAKFEVRREGAEARVFEAKICLKNGCDGMTAFAGGLLTQDMSCLNQLPGLIASNRAFRFRHTGDSRQRVSQAQSILAKAVAAADAERLNLVTLEAWNMDQKEIEEFIFKFLTGEDALDDAYRKAAELKGRAQTTFINRAETLMELYQDGTNNRGNTALDMLSAVTEFYDFAAGSKSDEATLMAEIRQNKLAYRTDDAINSFVRTQNEATDAYDRAKAMKRAHSNHFGGQYERAKVRARKLLTKTN